MRYVVTVLVLVQLVRGCEVDLALIETVCNSPDLFLYHELIVVVDHFEQVLLDCMDHSPHHPVDSIVEVSEPNHCIKLMGGKRFNGCYHVSLGSWDH